MTEPRPTGARAPSRSLAAEKRSWGRNESDHGNRAPPAADAANRSLVGAGASGLDDHFAQQLVFSHVPQSLGGLAQRVDAVDDGGDFARFEEFSQHGYGLFPVGRRSTQAQLFREEREKDQFEHAGDKAHEPSARRVVSLVSDQDVFSVGFERAPACPKRVVAGDVEDQIVANAAAGEVLLSEIDDLIRAEREEPLGELDSRVADLEHQLMVTREALKLWKSRAQEKL